VKGCGAFAVGPENSCAFHQALLRTASNLGSPAKPLLFKWVTPKVKGLADLHAEIAVVTLIKLLLRIAAKNLNVFPSTSSN
jgi:hypothetical protein